MARNLGRPHSERLELTPTRMVYRFSSSLRPVTRACIDALHRMGWETQIDTRGVLTAREPWKWWHALWAWPQKMTITAVENDEQTILRITHFNYLGSVRPGYLRDQVEAMRTIIDELLRDAAKNPS